MIDFNFALESLGDSISMVRKISKQFAMASNYEVINLISSLDPSTKGYLTYGELAKNGSAELINFLKKNF